MAILCKQRFDRSGFPKEGPKSAGPASGITLLPQQCIFIEKPTCLGPTPLFKSWVAPMGHKVVTTQNRGCGLSCRFDRSSLLLADVSCFGGLLPPRTVPK